MARIRTIKPEFFRHEGLQDVEAENPGSYAMLVFAALWGHCDKAGRFEWKPRTLKLDILPFLDYDLQDTLAILVEAGFIRYYEIDGKPYGEITSFKTHQRLGGKEAQEPEKHPAPTDSDPTNPPKAHVKQERSNGEATVKQLPAQERKGKEGKGRGKETEGKGSTVTTMPREEFEAFALSRATQPIATAQEEEPEPPTEEDEGANYRSDPDVIHLGDAETKPIRRRSDLLVQDFERRQADQRPMSHIGAMLGGITAKPIQTESEDDIEAKRRLIRDQARGAA